MDIVSFKLGGGKLLQHCTIRIAQCVDVSYTAPTSVADKWEKVDCNATLACAEQDCAEEKAGLPPAAGLSQLLSVVVLTLGGNEILRRGFPLGTSVAKLRTLLQQAAPAGSKARILRRHSILDDDELLDFLSVENEALHAVFELDNKEAREQPIAVLYDELYHTCWVADDRVVDMLIATLPRLQGQSCGSENMHLQIRQEMRGFLRDMLRGRELILVGSSGQLRLCKCTLDRRLRSLKLEMYGVQRSVRLSSIIEVSEGLEPVTIPTPLDVRCATIMLESGGTLTFRLHTVVERQLFVRCLKVVANLM